MKFLGITGCMRFIPTFALEVMLIFINQEARQVARRLLENGCSYMPNLKHLEVLIKMTDETWRLQRISL
jgi:hypothetical protein